MKTFATLAAASMASVNANFNFGACKSFTDQGMADAAFDINAFGTGTWIEVFRTSDTANENMGDC